jgi:hypothetical protein
MKKSLLSAFIFLGASLFVISCTKNNNNYSSADHTVGLANKTYKWTGTANGYTKGDTLFTGDTTHHEWPKIYSRTIVDTSFMIQKINGFEIAVLGAPINYISTDSTSKIVTFDTTYSGSAMTILKFYYSKDSISYEYHKVTGFNSAANQYYQSNMVLHTHP